MTIICIRLIGIDEGPEIVGRFFKMQKNLSREFQEGRNAGGQELFNSLNGDADFVLVKRHIAKNVSK